MKINDVTSFAQGLEDDYLTCRTWAHSWDPGTSTVRRESYRIYWAISCRSCGTARTRVISPRGEIIANQYQYPDGYTLKGIGRIDSGGLALFRLEALERIWKD